MVKLSENSPHNEKETPFLHKWDTEYRRNFDLYQREIDKITYHLQRSQRGLWFTGSWLYPYLHQREFMLLDIYKKKQVLGKILKEDIQGYQQINSSIENDLDKTFSAHWYLPWRGLAAGGGFFFAAHLFNIPYSYRLGLILVPVAFDYISRWSDVDAYHRSLRFLNWTIEYRKAIAQTEVDRKHLNIEGLQSYKQQVKSTKPVLELYQDVANLFARETIEELKDK